MNSHDLKQLEDFLAAIDSHLVAYKHSAFSYVAVRDGDVFELAQARLMLLAVPHTMTSKRFETKNIRAEVCRFTDLNIGLKGFIEKLLSGSFGTAFGEFCFPPEQNRQYSIYFNEFHSDGILSQNRQMQLFIRGRRRDQIDTPRLDWEVRSAPLPFENMQELLREFAIISKAESHSTVEILTFPIAAINAQSTVKGAKAQLGINLANGLAREKSSLGFRLIERNSVVKRELVPGAALTWKNGENYQSGQIEMDVNPGSVLHCVASYEGRAQHHYWVADKETVQNPWRAIHQTFDNNLDVMHDLIRRAQSKGANARDLEIAIAWLLWMLGFSTTYLGAHSKTSEAPDLVAATPQGNLLIIECTTGILKEDNKLPHIVERTEKVRKSLIASGNQHLKVLPVIVTTKTRDEVRADLEQAQKLGILVVTQEDLSQIVGKTILYPDANLRFVEAENALARGQKTFNFEGV